MKGTIKLTDLDSTADNISLTTFNTGNITLNSVIASDESINLSVTVADGELNLQAISGINDLSITNNSLLTLLNGDLDIAGTFDTTTTTNISLNGSLTLAAMTGIDTRNTKLSAPTSVTTLTTNGDLNLGKLELTTDANLADGSTIIASGKLILHGDITAATNSDNSLDFSAATAIELNQDITLTGNLLLKNSTSSVNINSVASVNDINARRLTVVGGNQNITLGAIGNDNALQSFSLTGTGKLTLDSTSPIPITVGNDGISFLGTLDLGSITELNINTASSNGSINLSGLNIDSAIINLNSGSGDISLGALGRNAAIASLVTTTSGAINLYGNINNADNVFDFSSASSVILHDNISFGSDELFVTSLLFGDASIEGNFDLDINATTLTLGEIGQNISLQNLSIATHEGALDLNHDINAAGNIIINSGLTRINSVITTSGGDININASADLNMSNTSSLSAPNGTLMLTSTEGDIALGSLSSLTSITLNASAGKVTNSINDFQSNEQTSTNLSSNKVVINAGAGIGSSVDSPVVINTGLSGNIALTSGGNVYIANIASSSISSNKDLTDSAQSIIATRDALTPLISKPQLQTELTQLVIEDPIWQATEDDTQLDNTLSAPRIYYNKKGWRLGNPE